MWSQKFFMISSIGHEVTLWLLFALSIVSLGIASERWIFLRSWKKSTKQARDQMKKAIENKDLDQIKSISTHFENSKKDPGTNLVKEYLDTNQAALTQVFRSFVLLKKSEFESGLSLLATTGSNAPFIGLLGTIFGVMDSFHALGLSSGTAAPIVMLGIAKALLATAVGLIVAIPAIVFYNYLRRQVRIILQNFEYMENTYLLYHELKSKNV